MLWWASTQILTLTAELETLWADSPVPTRQAILEDLEASEAPFDSAIIRFLAWTIADGDGDGTDHHKSKASAKVVVAAWKTLQRYLGRFRLLPRKQVLMGAGVDPGALHVRARDAACRLDEYQLAEQLNRPLLDPVFRGLVDETTEQAWFRHLAILKALGRWHAVRAHLDRLQLLLRQYDRDVLLDDLAPWQEQCRAQLEAGCVGTETPRARVAPEKPVPEADLPEVLDVKQTAAALHVSNKTIYGWAKTGKLPKLDYGGSRLVRFRRDDVLALRNEVRQSKRATPGKTLNRRRGGGREARGAEKNKDPSP